LVPERSELTFLENLSTKNRLLEKILESFTIFFAEQQKRVLRRETGPETGFEPVFNNQSEKLSRIRFPVFKSCFVLFCLKFGHEKNPVQ